MNPIDIIIDFFIYSLIIIPFYERLKLFRKVVLIDKDYKKVPFELFILLIMGTIAFFLYSHFKLQSI